MRRLTSFRIIRITLAFAVALWMAGAGCLLGCENNSAAASTNLKQPAKATVLVASGGTCAHHRANAKHVSNAQQVSNSPSAVANQSKATKRSAANPLTFAFGASPSSMMDCPLAVNTTAALSKTGTDNAYAQFALTSVNQPSLDSLEQTTALAPPPRLPNRGHTYLRCCVFLI